MTLSQRNKNILVCQGGFHVAPAVLLGVMKRFQEKGMRIDEIDASSGATIVALLSKFKSLGEIETMLTPRLVLSLFPDFNQSFIPPFSAPLQLNALVRFLEKQVGKKTTFRDIDGLRITSTFGDAFISDNGSMIGPMERLAVVFGQGFTEDVSPSLAVAYSCSYPGVFKPLRVSNTKVTVIEGVRHLGEKTRTIRHVATTLNQELPRLQELVQQVNNNEVNPDLVILIGCLYKLIAHPNNLVKCYLKDAHKTTNQFVDLVGKIAELLEKLEKISADEKPEVIELFYLLKKFQDQINEITRNVSAITIYEREVDNCIAEDGGIRHQYPITTAVIKAKVPAIDETGKDCFIPIFEDPETTNIYVVVLNSEPDPAANESSNGITYQLRRMLARSPIPRLKKAVDTLVNDQFEGENSMASILGFNVIPIHVHCSTLQVVQFCNLKPLIDVGYKAASKVL